MSTDNDILEVYKSASQLQEKYIFYLVALGVSAIGFSVYCTMNKPLLYSHILLGIAVLLWSISIFSGLKYIKWAIEAKRVNYQKLEHLSLRQTMSPEKFLYLINILEDYEKKYGRKLQLYFPLQENCFYSGVIFFIVWHVIEMALVK